MRATYEQERVGDYITVHSGRNFYCLDPKPEDITIEDMAHSLSNLCRFTGHGSRFYSVAEHSILCARVARKLGMDEFAQIYALLHDVAEAIVNDLARPIKQNIPEYKAIEDNIMSVLWKVLGLPEPSADYYHLVKLLDNTLLVNEMIQLMNSHDFEGIEYIPFSVNLSTGYGAGEAKQDFLSIYKILMIELEVKGWLN